MKEDINTAANKPAASKPGQLGKKVEWIY